MPTCPVCKMEVDANVEWQTSHEGATYHFCAAACQRAFERNPQRFLVPRVT